MAPRNASFSTEQGERSPIAKLLETLGMTREDLTRHSAQMREFLLTENPGALRSLGDRTSSSSNSSKRHGAVLSILTRSLSESRSQEATTSSLSHPPKTPPPGQPHATHYPRHTSKPLVHNTEQNIARVTEKRISRHRKDKGRSPARSATSPMRSKPSLDMIMQMQSRNSRCVGESEESEDSDDTSIEDVFSGGQGKSRASPRYRYPHPAKASHPFTRSRDVATSNSKSANYYKQDSPSVSSGGNYYRHRDTFIEPPATPTTSSAKEQDCRRVTPASLQTVTPTRSYYRQQEGFSERLPPSSPILASSPIQSSPDYPVDVSSSPGPMSDPPDQSDPDLPYTLPPGPYSEEKPDLSYAALIGRAILASSIHALRLKDIYDYISIVFPYYKRGTNSHSQKWMNAIRQNLTNTPQFHKRDSTDRTSRAKGSLWYIRDEDLPCFNNGGYFRHANGPFNMQMVNERAEKKRKRAQEEKYIMESAKRIRSGLIPPAPTNPHHFPYGCFHVPPAYPFAGMASTVQAQVQSDVIFPPLPSNHPNAHLVNGSQPHMKDDANDGIIFPPLPAFSQTRIVWEQKEQELSASQESAESTLSDDERSLVSAPPMSAVSSVSEMSSIPDLTPNNSSSSPAGLNEENQFVYPQVNVQVVDSNTVNEQSQPLEQAVPSSTENASEEGVIKDLLSVIHRLPPMPTTPTAKGRRGSSTLHAVLIVGSETSQEHAGGRPLTPPRPSTPAGRLSVQYNESLMRTPIGRRASGRRPAAGSEDPDERLVITKEDAAAALYPPPPDAFPKTPLRQRVSNGQPGPSASFVTPRKLLFSSPFPSFSPFRTPSRRNVFDAADPSHMLDEELTALASNAANTGTQDSPVGFFAKGKGLLYESPCMPSPGPYRPW